MGWETFDVRRTPSHVSAEYDADRYAPRLSFEGSVEAHKVREFELLGMSQEKPEFFSLGERFSVTNELIDHNHDLFTLLRSRSDVEILAFEHDVFGSHPLNSASTVVWRFR